MRLIVSTLILFSSFSAMSAEPNRSASVREGFITGNQFRTFSSDMKRGYAMGFIDGAFVAPFFNAPEDELRWIERCTKNMTEEQIVAIFEKFLRDNPARWQQPMNLLAWNAMKEGCGK